MRLRTRILLALPLVVLAALAWPAWWLYEEFRKAASEDPAVWEEDIRALEAQAPFPSGALLFTGSSSIRLWSTLADDMAPFTVIRRGFGGAKLGDLVHYAERLVDVPEPLAIVVFAGTNDLHPGATKPPEVLEASWRDFVARARGVHPRVPIYYIAITPTPLRWEAWPLAQETNERIAGVCAESASLRFIATAPAFLDATRPWTTR